MKLPALINYIYSYFLPTNGYVYITYNDLPKKNIYITYNVYI